jgi:hypothetical protein
LSTRLPALRAIACASLLVLANSTIRPSEAQLAPLPVDVVHATTPLGAEWRFVGSLYGWMPGIYGETGVGNLSADVRVSFSDLLSHLRFAQMATFEASRGSFVGILDEVYASIRVDNTLSRGRVQPNVDLTLKLLIAQAFAAYTVKPSPRIDVDLLAGGRLWAVRSTLALSGDILHRENERSPSWGDALLGARLRWRANAKWQFSLQGDGGAGGSKGTGEGTATASYAFARYWSAYAGYRYLYENYQKGDYFFTGHLTGPVIGAAYHW